MASAFLGRLYCFMKRHWKPRERVRSHYGKNNRLVMSGQLPPLTADLSCSAQRIGPEAETTSQAYAAALMADP
jgi:hypothetical protein